MTGPGGFERRTRAAILIAIAAIVVIAPLVGVYAFSPLLFAGGLEPYQLAVGVSVMLAEAIALAALVFLVLRAKK
jgi:hypothetical protein